MTKWYNWINEVLSGVGIIIGADLTQTKEILGIVVMVLNIIVLILSVLLKLYSWYKKSSADGKITREEMEEGANILKEGIDEITSALPDDKKGESHDSKGKTRQD